jgi:hypothetical protein
VTTTTTKILEPTLGETNFLLFDPDGRIRVSDKYEFVSLDDPEYVTANPVVQAGLNPESAVWAFTTDRDGNWFPLTWLSHLLIYLSWRAGGEPGLLLLKAALLAAMACFMMLLGMLDHLLLMFARGICFMKKEIKKILKIKLMRHYRKILRRKKVRVI